MWQKVEWDVRRPRRRVGRAFRNALLLLFAAGSALAIAPPRPGGEVTLPAALARWSDPRPGLPLRFAATVHGDKSAAGQHRLVVIPGGFSDRAGTIAQSTLQARFTGTSSVRDYYLAASGGALEVVGEVQGWQRVSRTVDYYAGDDNGMDPWSAPNNAGRFVWDAVSQTDTKGFDWGRYDNDGPDGEPNSGDDDGYVDCVVVLHAGPGGECGTSQLWSHCFFLAGWGYGAYTTASARHGGGFIKVDDYILVPELSCTSGAIEIGVICHEYGHVLGLPDLYDTVADGAGIGGWGRMGTGSWGGDGHTPASPSLPCAWSRRELGWGTTVTVREDGAVTLPAGQVLVIQDPDMPAGEVFLVENRRRAGFDASLPAAGLLIWHVDQAVIAATRPLNEVNGGPVAGVALEQADGQDLLGTNRGDAGDPWPGTSGATHFAADTLPRSHTNQGVRTDVVVRGIPTPRDPAAFTVEIGVADLDETAPAVAVLAPAGGEAWTLGDPQTVVWTATDANGVAAVDLDLSRDGGATYPVVLARGLANAGAWTGSLGAVPGEALRVRVTARDPAANAGTAPSGVFALCDRYAPGVAWTGGPQAGEQLDPGAQVTVAWQSADNVGVAGVELELSCDDGVEWQATGLAGLPASGSADWTVPDLPCRQARLRALARDAAGNLGWDTSPVFAIAGATTGVPDAMALRLGPCIPNPFNPQAEILFSLPAAGNVRVAVHDAAGRRLRTLVDEFRPSGAHRALWNGRDDQGRALASGVYWVRAVGPGGQALLKVTLVR